MKLINREGSKFRYANEIIKHFPEHDCYIEPFFGTGAIYFNKPVARYNMLNDRAEFIYNLFYTIQNDGWEALYNKVEKTLIYDKIINENKDKFEYQIISQVCSIFGSQSSIAMEMSNDKKVFLDRLKIYGDKMMEMLKFARMTNKDVFDFLNSIHLRYKINICRWDHLRCFTYCDPPYSVSKGSLKDNKGWGIDKLEELIKWLKNKNGGGMKFAISEYSDPEVIDLFEKYKLNILEIKRSTGIAKCHGHNKFEILAVSYSTQSSFF